MKTWFLFLFLWSDLQGNLLKKLDRKEKLKLAREPVVKESTQNDSYWPAITLYMTIPLTPLEAVAVFAAYDHQKDYVPGVVLSTPIKHVSSTEVWCRYRYRSPWPLPDVNYVHTNRLKAKGKAFEVEWEMIESDAMDRVYGRAVFEPFNGQTLLEYHVESSPYSVIAFFFKGRMKREVVSTVSAIVSYMGKMKRKNPILLEKYKGYITDALAGKKVYKDVIKGR